MTRVQVFLAILAGILLVVLFYLFLWQPRSDEIAEVRTSIEQVEAQERQVRTEIARLQAIREDAAELEADLNAAGAILPASAAGPALLRQLQLASDEAGLDLQSVTFGRPVVSGLDPELAELTVNVNVQGSYFQVVDFLRRVEDPAITPRGVLWGNASLSIIEHPALNVVLTGRVFADAEGAIPPDVIEPDEDADEPADDLADDLGEDPGDDPGDDLGADQDDVEPEGDAAGGRTSAEEVQP